MIDYVRILLIYILKFPSQNVEVTGRSFRPFYVGSTGVDFMGWRPSHNGPLEAREQQTLNTRPSIALYISRPSGKAKSSICVYEP